MCLQYIVILLYSYFVKSVITTRVTLVTWNLNTPSFSTYSPHCLNTFLLWVRQAFLFFFDCSSTTFYATEEGTSSTRIQSSWSSLKIGVYLQAGLQKFSKVVKANKIHQYQTSEYKAFS